MTEILQRTRKPNSSAARSIFVALSLSIIFVDKDLRQRSTTKTYHHAGVGVGAGIRPNDSCSVPRARVAPAASLVTGAGILRPLAAAASAQVELEAEVLRLCVGGLLELHDEVVAVAFGVLGLAYKRGEKIAADVTETSHSRP